MKKNHMQKSSEKKLIDARKKEDWVNEMKRNIQSIVCEHVCVCDICGYAILFAVKIEKENVTHTQTHTMKKETTEMRRSKTIERWGEKKYTHTHIKNIKIWNIYACFQHNKCRTSQNIKHILFSGKNILKFVFKFWSLSFFSLLSFSISLLSHLECRINCSFAHFASVKIWSKPNHHRNMNIAKHSHIDAQMTKKNEEKHKENIGCAFVWNVKLWFGALRPLLLLNGVF